MQIEKKGAAKKWNASEVVIERSQTVILAQPPESLSKALWVIERSIPGH